MVTFGTYVPFLLLLPVFRCHTCMLPAAKSRGKGTSCGVFRLQVLHDLSYIEGNGRVMKYEGTLKEEGGMPEVAIFFIK